MNRNDSSRVVRLRNKQHSTYWAILCAVPTLCWLTVSSAVAQPVTTYGTLSNFDAINDIGHDCHGFEIELEGISPSDVVCTFGASGDPANPYNRYGDPTVISIAGGAIVRYASAYDSINHVWAATTPQATSPYPVTMGHQCWSLGDPNYPNSGCEHYGVCLNRNATRTVYRWLIEDAAHPGSLTPFGSNVNIPAPVWQVAPQPPPAPGLPPPPPIVIAVIPAPPPPPIAPGGIGQWGEAIWEKIFVMELAEPIEIEDLLLGGIAVPDPDVEAPEIEWQLLQSAPVGRVGPHEESENGGEVGGGAEVVSRRYEFYKYTGDYDPEDHEAKCDNPLAGDPRCGPVDPDTGLAGVGDLIGAQNAAVNLFEQSIGFTKTADTQLSEAGEVVNYTLALDNTSTPGSPDMECTITDATLGVNTQVTLAPGAGNVTQVAYTVQASDPDPLINTASVSCGPIGFPDVVTASSDWTVNLFQPSVMVTKTGPVFSKATDTATYDVMIENTSSADSPNLVLTGVSDSVVSGVTPDPSCNILAPGASCSFSYAYVVQQGDPDPLENTATAHHHPAGFPNDMTSSSTWTTDLLHPSFTITKVCKAEPVSQTEPAVFTITCNNTGDADLHVEPSEGAAFDVAAGGSFSYDHSIAGPFSEPVNNTVTGTVTLALRYSLSNSYNFSASGSCTVAGDDDVDGDGVIDSVDLCCNTPAGVEVDAEGRPIGDLDGDCDNDLDDFAIFSRGVTGPLYKPADCP